MEWLGIRLRGWRPPRRAAPKDKETQLLEVAEESKEAIRHDGPPLMLLVPDASGLTSFRPYTFARVEAAAEFIQFWYRPGMKHGVVAFWALGGEPEPGPCVEVERLDEVVVVIGDPARPGVVYPFSFVDMESARSFIRREAERGLDLRHVAMHWAAPVTVEFDGLGVARLSPAAPPPIVQGKPTAEPLPAAEPARPLAEASAIMHSPAWPLIESDGRVESLSEADPGSELEAASASICEEDPVSTTSAAGLLTIPSNGSVESLAEVEPLMGIEWSGPGGEEAELDIEIDPAGLLLIGPNGSDESLTDVRTSEETAEEFAETQPAEACGGEDADQAASEPMTGEMGRALRMKRWEAREGPFRGFGSPPGKF